MIHAYTDISFVNRWTVDSDGELVRFFGWAIAIKGDDGKLIAVKQGVETVQDECTHNMESRAIAIARAILPDAIIISDCKTAAGYDQLANMDDPFHRIVHFASRDALYTRLVTAGHSFKNRNKIAAIRFAHSLRSVETEVLP